MRQFNGTAVVLAAIVLVVALAPLLYVASTGPVVWLSERGIIDTNKNSVAYAIYWPVEYAANNNGTVDTVLTSYISLFSPPNHAVYDPVAPAAGAYYDPVPQGASMPTQRPTIPSPY